LTAVVHRLGVVGVGLEVRATLRAVSTAAYISTVVSICALSIGAMYAIVGQLGRRIDDLRADMETRFAGLRGEMDARFTGVEGRLGRLETQGDMIIRAVSDLGERVTRLEARTAS